jgi:hypothetical protein
MTGGKLEQRWVDLRDSPSWRRWASSTLARRVMDGPSFRHLDMTRRRLLARLETARAPRVFEEVEALCLFIGHVKSGGTLLGSILDAHPDALLADEVDVLDLVSAGFGRDEVFHVLAKGARREAMKGRVTARRLEAYSLAVPGQWQGRSRGRPLVVGESRAGPTTRKLGGDPALMSSLLELAGTARLAFVHVVRNPLDPIGAMVRRGNRSVEAAAADYAQQAERLERLRETIPEWQVHTVHYERLLDDPASTIVGVLGFLGLPVEAPHLEASVALVDGGLRPERQYVDWSPAHLDAVRHIVAAHPFLSPYRAEFDVEVGPA